MNEIPIKIRILLWTMFCMVMGAFIQALGNTDSPLWTQIVILIGVMVFTYLSFDKLFRDLEEKQ